MQIKDENKYGSTVFWLFQSVGWLSISSLLAYWNMNSVNALSASASLQSSSLFMFFGILLSFIYRQYMVYHGWLRLSLSRLFPRVILGSIALGTVFSLIISIILDLFFPTIEPIIQFPYLSILGLIINSALIFMLWSSIYLNYNYYKNYEREDIKNLRLLASNREMELQNLKSQLNPHFIFNAMNSIKALIEEDPQLAKQAITKLSSILRNSLLASSGEFVSITEEINIAKKYLSLEKIRYEERLNYSFNINDQLLSLKIPPLLINTLIENAVKHGIATHATGGSIKIKIEDLGKDILISVTNPGTYIENNITGTGIGLSNIKKRISLLYGNQSKLEIRNKNRETVITTINIPKLSKYESNNNRR